MSAGRPEIHTHTSRTARKRDKTTKQKMNDTDKTKAAHTGVHNSFFSASSLVNMRAIENKNGKKKEHYEQKERSTCNEDEEKPERDESSPKNR
jgi:hypothetical protein